MSYAERTVFVYVSVSCSHLCVFIKFSVWFASSILLTALTKNHIKKLMYAKIQASYILHNNNSISTQDRKSRIMHLMISFDLRSYHHLSLIITNMIPTKMISVEKSHIGVIMNDIKELLQKVILKIKFDTEITHLLTLKKWNMKIEVIM